jgi:hypothetical protein
MEGSAGLGDQGRSELHALDVICGLAPRIHLSSREVLFSKKRDHRVKPGDDESWADLRCFSLGQPKNSPESGWIATISKPRFRAGIKLKAWSDRIWSQP